MGKSQTFEGPYGMEISGRRGVCDKSVLPGGYEYFLKLHNFNSIRGSQTLGDGLYVSSPFRVASKTIRERMRPSLSFRMLLAFAFHDIRLTESLLSGYDGMDQ